MDCTDQTPPDGDFTISSTGPSVAAIEDQDLNLRGLKTNGDSKYYHAFLVKIADPDSPSDALDLTATATSSKVAVSIEAVDGVADTYKLTVLFKEEKPSEVTFKVDGQGSGQPQAGGLRHLCCDPEDGAISRRTQRHRC